MVGHPQTDCHHNAKNHSFVNCRQSREALSAFHNKSLFIRFWYFLIPSLRNNSKTAKTEGLHIGPEHPEF